MNKYEQLIEHIINDNEEAAKQLFHSIVVEKSRDIYESLMDEEQVEENFGGNPAEQFVSDVQDGVEQDEQGLGEDDLEGGEFELDGGDDSEEETFGGDEVESEEEEIVSKLDSLEAELAELKALLAGEECAPEVSDSGDEVSDFDSEEEQGEEEQFAEGANPFAKSGSGKSGSGASGSGKSGSGASGSGKSGSGVKESRKLSDVEIMKEYVDKIGEIYKQEPAGSEGKEVGKGGSVNVNKDDVVAGENDMGGSTANIAKGGAEQNPDGAAPTKANNYGTKGQGQLIGKVANTPGADAGKSSFKTKEAGKTKEGSTTDGSVPVNTKSEIGGKVR